MSTQNICKLVIVGDGAVGKTCLLSVYVNNEFPKDYVPTVFENLDTVVRHNEKLVKLYLWDTAGQEEYDKLRYLSYANSNIFLVAFSVNSRSSFDNISQRWLPELKKHSPTTKLILIGLKVDLRDDKTEQEKLQKEGSSFVTKEEGDKLAQKIGAIKYVECSARSNTGVQEIFTTCIEFYFANQKKKGCLIL